MYPSILIEERIILLYSECLDRYFSWENGFGYSMHGQSLISVYLDPIYKEVVNKLVLL